MADALENEVVDLTWEDFREPCLKTGVKTEATVKSEVDVVDETLSVPLSNIFFIRASISSHFRNGTALEDTIRALMADITAGVALPDYAKLHVVEVNKQFFSLSSRRLYCLKQAAERAARSLSVNVRVHNANAPNVHQNIIAKFIHAWTTGNSGRAVRVRPVRVRP